MIGYGVIREAMRLAIGILLEDVIVSTLPPQNEVSESFSVRILHFDRIQYLKPLASQDVNLCWPLRLRKSIRKYESAVKAETCKGSDRRGDNDNHIGDASAEKY